MSYILNESDRLLACNLQPPDFVLQPMLIQSRESTTFKGPHECGSKQPKKKDICQNMYKITAELC